MSQIQIALIIKLDNLLVKTNNKIRKFIGKRSDKNCIYGTKKSQKSKWEGSSSVSVYIYIYNIYTN